MMNFILFLPIKMNVLCNNMIKEIINYMNNIDINQLCLINNRYYKLLHDDTFWKRKYIQEYGIIHGAKHWKNIYVKKKTSIKCKRYHRHCDLCKSNVKKRPRCCKNLGQLQISNIYCKKHLLLLDTSVVVVNKDVYCPKCYPNHRQLCYKPYCKNVGRWEKDVNLFICYNCL
jgi:hypothetical protein